MKTNYQRRYEHRGPASISRPDSQPPSGEGSRTRRFSPWPFGALQWALPVLVLAASPASTVQALEPALSLSIPPAPAGSATTAVIRILNPDNIESFSLKLSFASGQVLRLPASGWFSRGAYFPSAPFGNSPAVELNRYQESSDRGHIYMDGFAPIGASGGIGGVELSVAPGAVGGDKPDTQVVSLSGEFWSATEETAKPFLPVAEEFVVGAAPAGADLSLTQTDSADPVKAAAQFSYTLQVANAGPDPAQNVQVQDTLPAGVAFVGVSGGDWNCNHAGGQVSCTRATLGVGQAPAIEIAVSAPDDAASLFNTAVVGSTTADPYNANDSADEWTTVTAVADLSLNKAVSPQP